MTRMLGQPERHDMTTEVRKGQAPGTPRAATNSASAFASSLRRPGVRGRGAGRSPASRRSPGTATPRAARRRSRARPARATPTPTTTCRSTGSRRRSAIDRGAGRAGPIRRRTTRALVICGSPRNDGTCPGEISKTLPPRRPGRARTLARRRDRGRLPRPQPAHLRVRPQDPSVQGLRLDRDAALPLAVQLLPEPLAGPDQRLDERDLRALGRRARDRHRHAGALVPARRARSS